MKRKNDQEKKKKKKKEDEQEKKMNKGGKTPLTLSPLLQINISVKAQGTLHEPTEIQGSQGCLQDSGSFIEYITDKTDKTV